MTFESCTLFHIMPFAKIIGHVEKNRTKSEFSPVFPLEYMQNQDLVNCFHVCIQGGNISNLKSRKKT